MIVITNPIPIANEINTIHSLFENGLELLHIRKPNFTEDQLKIFISKIELEFHSKLVLHQNHNLAEEFGINRIHFTENKRSIYHLTCQKLIESASTHSIEDFNSLNTGFNYAFLSPIYQSISKPNYVPRLNLIETVKQRTNFKTKLVALGGISSENITETYKFGFDSVALLGTIWNSKNPIENFKLCQQFAHWF
ncbi:thiamine phosphate synthase [Flavobacterium sp. WC2430]|uniref:thiamine phosphate synthase n=1 Tax=Flavobacterium sp. WC2430 TaxID=3234137 RepID=UPI00346686AE